MDDVNLRVPNHTDPLTFEEQIELEHQMELITQLPDPPQERPMSRCEWENVQRMAETLRLYRETSDPEAVNDSLPKRKSVNGINYLPYRYDVVCEKTSRGAMSALIRRLHSLAVSMSNSGVADRCKAGDQFLDVIEPWLDDQFGKTTSR